jgi:hypothetical protein
MHVIHTKTTVSNPICEYNWDICSIKFMLLRIGEKVESITFTTKDTQHGAPWNQNTCLQFCNAVTGHIYLKALTLDSVIANVNQSDVLFAIQSLPNLTDLIIPNNKLTNDHVDYLLRTIDLNRLESIDLSNNRFNPNKVADIMQSITDDHRLRYLNLSSLGINDSIFHHIASRLLYKQSRLTTLLLNNNFITCKGIEDVAGILSSNRSLTHLYLKNNCITSTKSIPYIVDILNSNLHLCTFDIEHSICENRNITPINNLLRRNRNARLYCSTAKQLARNENEAIPLALWPRILTNVPCPDDLYDLVSILIPSRV